MNFYLKIIFNFGKEVFIKLEDDKEKALESYEKFVDSWIDQGDFYYFGNFDSKCAIKFDKIIMCEFIETKGVY